MLVLPDFGPNPPDGLADFNDMHQHQGREAVAECIAAQVAAHAQDDAPRGGPDAAPGRDSQDKEGPRGAGTDQAGKARADSGIVALEISELLTRKFPAKESLLSPWIRLQDLVMIYSKRGVGKTHLCLALAYAIASGGQFLKWAAPEPRRVLYIDGEMPGVAIQERLAALVDANELEPPEGFFWIVTPDVQHFSLPDLATVEGQAAFSRCSGMPR